MINDTLKTEECPICKKISKFIPPTKTDKINKKLIVNFECPEGHFFSKEENIL
jgi:hypothetical protein